MSMTEQMKSPPIAATSVKDIQRDLSALRSDVARLTQEVSTYLSDTSRQTLRDADEQLEGAIRERPFVAVAIAAGLGLLFGMFFWRR